MYLPNQRIFGSDMLKIQLPKEAFDTDNRTSYFQVYRQEFELSTIRWRALNNKKQRCDDERTSKDETVFTTECIVQYLEKEVGCTMAQQGSKLDIKR